MGESWASANARMACFDCGESGAQPYTTTAGPNPGKHVRVCLQCVDRWEWLKLVSRERMFEEPKAPPSDRRSYSPSLLDGERA